MASVPKRKRLSKAQKRQIFCDKSKKARTELVLPAKWDTDVKEFPSNQAMVFVSPGKTRYNKKQADAVLKDRGMDLCFSASSSSSESSSDDCVASHADDEVEVENHFLVCESSQVMKLIHEINATSQYATPGCNGK